MSSILFPFNSPGNEMVCVPYRPVSLHRQLMSKVTFLDPIFILVIKCFEPKIELQSQNYPCSL